MNTGFAKLTFSETQAVCKALANETTGDNEKRAKTVIAAFLRGRRGEAAGSTAVHQLSGRSATRYFDTTFQCLRWVVWDNPESRAVNAERMDSLPNQGSGWVVHERSWEELV